MQDHERPAGLVLVSIWQFVCALLLLLLALAIVLLPILSTIRETPRTGDILWPVWGFALVLFVFLALAVVYALIGWGLLRLSNWARIAAIVFSLFPLSFFPIGTAAAVLTVWYLLRPEARDHFATGRR